MIQENQAEALHLAVEGLNGKGGIPAEGLHNFSDRLLHLKVRASQLFSQCRRQPSVVADRVIVPQGGLLLQIQKVDLG